MANERTDYEQDRKFFNEEPSEVLEARSWPLCANLSPTWTLRRPASASIVRPAWLNGRWTAYLQQLAADSSRVPGPSTGM